MRAIKAGDAATLLARRYILIAAVLAVPVGVVVYVGVRVYRETRPLPAAGAGDDRSLSTRFGLGDVELGPLSPRSSGSTRPSTSQYMRSCSTAMISRADLMKYSRRVA